MSVLHDAVALIREAERLVIGRTFRSKNRFISDLVDSALHGPWFVLAGMQNLAHLLVRWFLLLLLFATTLHVIIWFSPGAAELSVLNLMGAAGAVAAGAVVFDLPSGFTTRGVREEHVSTLAQYVATHARDSHTTGLLRQGVEEIGAMGRRRISAISWLIGVVWAALLWVASTWLMEPDVSPVVRSSVASYSFLAFFFFVALAIAFASYREAHRLLSQTIVFAFLEVDANRVAMKKDER